MSDDSVEDSSDALAETELVAAHGQPGDVDVGDTFLAALDHVWVGPAGPGIAIAGYDASDNEIGRISVYPLGPEMLRITHRYPRPCVIENSGEVVDATEDCADVADINVSLAGEPDDHWHDVYQTLPANVLMQRMQAMEIMAENQPQESAKDLRCVLTITGATGGCLVGSVTVPVVGAIGCSAALWAAVCSCKKQAQKMFPDLDLNKICD